MIQFETGQGLVEIRELQAIAEMNAAEEIQRQVWGSDISPHPKELLIPIQHEGGLLAGAFAQEDQLVGLVFGFPTRDPSVLHSQILCTLEGWRGQGIGRRLKWYQRHWCLARGITLVRWTVDPLRAANAELNVRHLGATASKYMPDYYGTMQGIDAGAPTDRLLVEWRLDSPRVLGRVEQPPVDAGFRDAALALSVEDGAPANPRLDLDDPRILLPIPEQFIGLSGSDPSLALAWRMHTRGLFQAYFTKGYRVTGFTRLGGPAYLLEREQ